MNLTERLITFGEIMYRSGSFEFPVVDTDEVTRYVYSNPFMSYEYKMGEYKPDYSMFILETLKHWNEIHPSLNDAGKALWSSIV